MKNNKKQNRIILSLVTLFVMTTCLVHAQQFNLVNKESSLKVFGTSSLHDWHITAEQQSGKIAFKNKEAGDIESINLDVVVEGLKSGKSSMDKNTYKALNSSSYKNVSFQLIEVKENVSKGNGKFTIKVEGNLTISGVKKRIPLELVLNVAGDKITLTGEKKMKMTDFKVNPPKALLGTITTGDDITIKFASVFNK